jgi:hypothetical protein
MPGNHFRALFGTLSYNHIEFIQDRWLGQAGMSGSAILTSLGDSHAIVHRDDESGQSR